MPYRCTTAPPIFTGMPQMTNEKIYLCWTCENIVQLSEVVTFRVSRRPREMYCGHSRLCVCLSVCLSAAVCPHYCTDTNVTWGSVKRCPLVVHYWADLQSVHGWRCYGNTMEMHGRAQRQSARPTACRTRRLLMPAKTPLASDKINAPAACAIPFRPYFGDVVTRTHNVSEYMLVLALCLVESSVSNGD